MYSVVPKKPFKVNYTDKYLWLQIKIAMTVSKFISKIAVF